MQREPRDFQSFDSTAEQSGRATATPRPAARPRSVDFSESYLSPTFEFFDCEMVELPAGAIATPRPKGRERRLFTEASNIAAEEVEQKVVSLLLETDCPQQISAPSKVEYFEEYLGDGWKVRQLTSISAGNGRGWIVVLLERTMHRK